MKKKKLKKIWDMLVKAMPAVVGTLGKTTKKLKQRVKDIRIETGIVELHKTSILYSARILRNFLEA